MLHAQLAALALAATTLAASGCGGSKTGSTTTAAAANASQATTTTTVTPPITPTPVKIASGKPLTRAVLIAKADAICHRTNAKLLAISIVSPRELGRLMPQVAVYNTTEASELSKLVPPAPMTHALKQIIGDLQLYSQYIGMVGQDAQASNYSAAATPLKAADNLRLQMQAFAKRNGFKHCSKGRADK